MPADAVDVFQHIVIPDPLHRPAEILQPRGPLRIPLSFRHVSMLRTIDLQDQAMRRAGEAGDGQLAADSETHKPMGADGVPKLQLGLGHDMAHPARVLAVAMSDKIVDHRRRPGVRSRNNGGFGGLRDAPHSVVGHGT